ncbi:MAG: NUDIX hydrolase [Balneolaceae bacterium]
MKHTESDNSRPIHNDLLEVQKSSSRVYDGKLLKVYVDDVLLPDGSTSTRDWIKHPGASAIVPVFEDGTVMLIKQFRYPSRRTFIEVPAGKIDSGESAKETAERELTEETGLSCKFIEKAGSFFPAIGYADEEIHVFVAWGLTQSDHNQDDDEFVIKHRVPFSDALNLVYSGKIQDAKTICSIMYAHQWWLKNKPFAINFS